MSYKLTIIKYKENPNYEAELAKFKEDTRFYSRSMSDNIGEPVKIIPERSLEVVLNDEEYESVKKGVLETFK